MNKRGKFIVFEGLDGSGKSTALDVIRFRLSQQCRQHGNRKVFSTREPSDNVPGLICRGMIKGLIPVATETEALLFAADRCEHIQTEILPQLMSGNHVLCDRYYFSNFAYQSAHSSLANLLAYNKGAMDMLRADATVFFDVHPEECARRRSLDRASEEKYENLERARITYEQYWKTFEMLKDEENIIVIDGRAGMDVVFERVWDALYGKIFTEEDFR